MQRHSLKTISFKSNCGVFLLLLIFFVAIFIPNESRATITSFKDYQDRFSSVNNSLIAHENALNADCDSMDKYTKNKSSCDSTLSGLGKDLNDLRSIIGDVSAFCGRTDFNPSEDVWCADAQSGSNSLQSVLDHHQKVFDATGRVLKNFANGNSSGVDPNASAEGSANSSGTDKNTASGSTTSSSTKPLENLPGFEVETQDTTSNFPTFLGSIYNLGVWIVGISALFMGSFGAFTYMTSAGNTSATNKGKEIIKDAIIGMILVLSTWLILNTINPELVNLDFVRLSSGGTPSESGGVTPADPVGSGVTGSCNGIKTSGAAGNQCELVSSALSGILKCMADKGSAQYGSVYSISASNVGNDLAKARSCCGNPSCVHATLSCHYGCGMSDQGHSHAADFAFPAGISNENLCRIAEIAWSCGAGKNIWGPKNIPCNGGKITYQQGHGTHLHIPTAACGH